MQIIEINKFYLFNVKRAEKKYKTIVEILDDLDENPLIGYISAVLKQFTRLLGLEPVDSEILELNIEKVI